jgi:hypothetical protein
MRRPIAIVLVVLAAAPGAAQTPPKGGGDPLRDICTSFLDQSGQGVAGDRNRLCTCLVRETKGRLTPQEMQAYNKAAQAGQAPPPAVMEKVVGIATKCLTEASR